MILDFDPEVFRLGYGKFDGLKVLESTATELGTMIQRQPGIRIGLVISDTTPMVYSPAPALIEAGATNLDSLNAVVFEKTLPEIERDWRRGEDGARSQVVGLVKAAAADVQKVEIDLTNNPVQRFDIPRTVRVFNAYFRVSGSAHRRSLPAHGIGLSSSVGSTNTQWTIPGAFSA